MILFTGCSVTWGDELENRLEERFSGSHINIAECGMSNDRMVMKTIEYIEQNPDVDYVVAQFSVPRRIVHYKKGWKNITPWTKNIESSVWYKYIDSQELRMMNLWKNVYILDQYLHSIPHYFWRISEFAETTLTEDCIFRKMTSWGNMVTMQDLIGTPKTNPEHYGKGHPNKKGHEIIGQHIQGILPK
tara:strand:+ start:553 stop:1116 length:564 start_codon:yes stop_codon:yes gene_type:complete